MFRKVINTYSYSIVILGIFFLFTFPVYSQTDAFDDSGKQLSEKGNIEGAAIILHLGYSPSLIKVNPYLQRGYTNIPRPYGIPIDLALKYKTLFFYARTGFSYSFQMSSSAKGGVVPEGTPKSYDVSFFKIPIIAGFNFFIQDQGSIQLGFGSAYINGGIDYSYKSSSRNTSLTGSVFAYVFQFVTEINISGKLVWSFEANTTMARSKALSPSGTKVKFKPSEIDFSSQEFLFGFGYYF